MLYSGSDPESYITEYTLVYEYYTGASPVRNDHLPQGSKQRPLFFFFNTLKPRVERYKKSMSLKYEPASEPLHIYVKQRCPLEDSRRHGLVT